MTERRRYTKRQKVTAIIAAEMSSQRAAAEDLGIPETTLQYWMDSPGFAELRAKTREDMAEESSVLAHKVLERIKDTLSSFEPRDLTILFGVLVDKAQLLTGQATSRTETRDLTDTFDDHEREALRRVLDDVLAVTE